MTSPTRPLPTPSRFDPGSLISTGPATPTLSIPVGQVHRHDPHLRCARALAYRHTAAAAATLRLSARPWIGTRTDASAAATTPSGRPCASLPNSHIVG